MPRKRVTTDNAPKKLSNNMEPERPLRYHEMMRMLFMGRIPPGDYRKETVYIDGRVKTESFRVDNEGRIRDIHMSIVRPRPKGTVEKKKKAKLQAAVKKRSSNKA